MAACEAAGSALWVRATTGSDAGGTSVQWPAAPEDADSDDSSAGSSTGSPGEEHSRTLQVTVPASVVLAFCPRATARFGSFVWDWDAFGAPAEVALAVLRAALGGPLAASPRTIVALCAALQWMGTLEARPRLAEELDSVLDRVLRDCAAVNSAAGASAVAEGLLLHDRAALPQGTWDAWWARACASVLPSPYPARLLGEGGAVVVPAGWGAMPVELLLGVLCRDDLPLDEEAVMWLAWLWCEAAVPGGGDDCLEMVLPEAPPAAPPSLEVCEIRTPYEAMVRVGGAVLRWEHLPGAVAEAAVSGGPSEAPAETGRGRAAAGDGGGGSGASRVSRPPPPLLLGDSARELSRGILSGLPQLPTPEPAGRRPCRSGVVGWDLMPDLSADAHTHSDWKKEGRLITGLPGAFPSVCVGLPACSADGSGCIGVPVGGARFRRVVAVYFSSDRRQQVWGNACSALVCGSGDTAGADDDPDAGGPDAELARLPKIENALVGMASTMTSDGRLWVGGGREYGSFSAKLWTLDLREAVAGGDPAGGASWQTGLAMPYGAMEFAMCAIGTRVFISGGKTMRGASSAVWSLETAAPVPAWEKLCDMPLKDSEHAMVPLATGRHLLVAHSGGYSGLSPRMPEWLTVVDVEARACHAVDVRAGSAALGELMDRERSSPWLLPTRTGALTLADSINTPPLIITFDDMDVLASATVHAMRGVPRSVVARRRMTPSACWLPGARLGIPLDHANTLRVSPCLEKRT